MSYRFALGFRKVVVNWLTKPGEVFERENNKCSALKSMRCNNLGDQTWDLESQVLHRTITVTTCDDSHKRNHLVNAFGRISIVENSLSDHVGVIPSSLLKNRTGKTSNEAITQSVLFAFESQLYQKSSLYMWRNQLHKLNCLVHCSYSLDTWLLLMKWWRTLYLYSSANLKCLHNSEKYPADWRKRHMRGHSTPSIQDYLVPASGYYVWLCITGSFYDEWCLLWALLS